MREVRLLPPLTIADNGITERRYGFADVAQLKGEAEWIARRIAFIGGR